MYAGADWIEKSLNKADMSLLGKAVADLLGDVFLGIYHLNTRALSRVAWNQKDYIEVSLGRHLCTFDGDELTRLVLLAHDRMLRVDVQPCNFNYLKLGISQRTTRQGNLYERCPTMETHIATLREHYQERATKGGA